jgi:hypothetical protein
MLQQNLLTFEQEWTDKSDGRNLPSFVTDELHDFLDCGPCRRTVMKILSAMGLPTEAPKLCPARPPPAESGGEGGDWLAPFVNALLIPQMWVGKVLRRSQTPLDSAML